MRDITIGRIMTTDPATVGPEDSVATAQHLLESRGIHHLPVLDGDKLVGILSSSDLMKLHGFKGNDKVGHEATEAITVGQIMEAEPITLDTTADLVDVAMKLSEGGFHALPVVASDDTLVGIVTSSDLVNHLLMQIPRGHGSVHEQPIPKAAGHSSDDDLTATMRQAKMLVEKGMDNKAADVLLHLREENRLLREVCKAAERYLRSDQDEHEHSVLVKCLADVQRFNRD